MVKARSFGGRAVEMMTFTSKNVKNQNTHHLVQHSLLSGVCLKKSHSPIRLLTKTLKVYFRFLSSLHHNDVDPLSAFHGPPLEISCVEEVRAHVLRPCRLAHVSAPVKMAV
jgi:hypothetical protein